MILGTLLRPGRPWLSLATCWEQSGRPPQGLAAQTSGPGGGTWTEPRCLELGRSGVVSGLPASSARLRPAHPAPSALGILRPSPEGFPLHTKAAYTLPACASWSRTQGTKCVAQAGWGHFRSWPLRHLEKVPIQAARWVRGVNIPIGTQSGSLAGITGISVAAFLHLKGRSVTS